MKKTLKFTCVLMAVAVFASSCTCNSPNKNKSGTDSLKADSAKKDSAKMDSAKKPAADTTVKKDSAGTQGASPDEKHPPSTPSN